MSFNKFIPGIAWFFIILFLICLPSSDIPSVNWLSKIYFDKWVHVGIFAVLLVLFCWPFLYSEYNNPQRKQYFIKILLATIVWAFTTELIQKYFVPGRSFDIMDWAADSVGALTAFWFCNKKFMKC